MGTVEHGMRRAGNSLKLVRTGNYLSRFGSFSGSDLIPKILCRFRISDLAKETRASASRRHARAQSCKGNSELCQIRAHSVGI